MSNISQEKYHNLQKEVSEIKDRLNKINDKKESWFKKKEDLKKVLNDNIQKIKQIKEAKDKNNVELQQLKSNRDKHNNEVQKLIKKIKVLNEEKAKAFKKYNVQTDPSKIQEKINELEKKVEVEVDFEKEKKLMEEIKKLKKSYEESSEVREIAEKAHSLDKEIKDSKKRADEFHKRIKGITEDTSYEVFIELSKKITEVKKEQEDAFQKFIDCKNEYSNVNHELKHKQEELQVLRLIFSKKKEIRKAEKTAKEQNIIEEKVKKVEEKLKTKKKLTTEDLIALQGTKA